LKTLIFGYGNQDRQDDGVAWHVLLQLKQVLGLDPDVIDDELDPYADFQVVFQLQLVPEHAEVIACFDRICFVDAHTGSVLEDVHSEIIHPVFDYSPLTHHLTPPSLLAITKNAYNKEPAALLVSVRGYAFGFTRELSIHTAQLVDVAVEKIHHWLKST